MNNTKAEL